MKGNVLQRKGGLRVGRDGKAASGLPGRLVQRVLDFPLFYKILVANTALMVGATLTGSWLGTKYNAAFTGPTVRWEFVASFGAVTLGAIVLVNYALLRAALQPIATLTKLIAALRQGQSHARAERPLFSDPQTNLLIETANSLLDELTTYRRQLEDLSERVTMQLENERRNIARELHDETAQNLAALLVLEQMITQATNPDKREEALQEVRQLTRFTLEGVRRMSLGLRPAILDEVGVSSALRWYVEELLGNVLPEVKLDLDDSLDGLSPVGELALYRIAQEALSNVVRHARAHTISVSLKQENGWAVLRIADDGAGFRPGTPSLQGREHLGLFTMRERARLAGGEAEVISEPGRGTTVSARLPLEKRWGPVGAQG